MSGVWMPAAIRLGLCFLVGFAAARVGGPDAWTWAMIGWALGRVCGFISEAERSAA